MSKELSQFSTFSVICVINFLLQFPRLSEKFRRVKVITELHASNDYQEEERKRKIYIFGIFGPCTDSHAEAALPSQTDFFSSKFWVLCMRDSGKAWKRAWISNNTCKETGNTERNEVEALIDEHWKKNSYRLVCRVQSLINHLKDMEIKEIRLKI